MAEEGHKREEEEVIETDLIEKEEAEVVVTMSAESLLRKDFVSSETDADLPMLEVDNPEEAKDLKQEVLTRNQEASTGNQNNQQPLQENQSH